jgi:DNA polymerase
MLQAQHMAHAVRRDIHKMKANLRMRTIVDGGGRELQVGCYEPAHHVMEVVAPWFCKRVPVARWAIFTPERSARCEDGRLLFGPGIPPEELPGPEGPDAAWLACYERVFAAHDRPAASHG